MAKVIVERPRHGSRLATKGKGYDRRAARLDWDDQPKREGMKVRGGRGKWLNEHLSPLRRYLARQVGKRWDKVFADVCRYLDRNSPVQDHVRDHLEDYVAIRVMIQGGQLSHADGYQIGAPLRSLFYVCPRTGILKENPNPRRWHSARHPKLKLHSLGNRTALVRKDGAWHIIEWSRWLVPDCRGIAYPSYPSRWDALLRVTLYHDQAQRLYGRAIYAVSARRASKREVREAVSSYPYTNQVRSR